MCCVTFVVIRHTITEPIDLVFAHMGEVIQRALQMAIPMIEPARIWPVFLLHTAKMPLAADCGGITSFLEDLGQGSFLQGQAIVSPWMNHTHLKAITDRIATGH